MQRALWIAIALASSGCDVCDSSDSYCDGNVLHMCQAARGGAYWSVADCEDKFCVELDEHPGVMCALEPQMRGACAPGQTDDYTCDGAERVLCSHGFAVDVEDCGDPTLCEIEINQCVARPGIDARCQQLPQPVSGVEAGYCDGETAVRCLLAFATEIVDCASKSMQCYELFPGVYPVCVASTTPDARCMQQNGGVYGVCIGNVAVSCANDRLISTTNCTGVCENGFCH